ncbi:MAG: hypothetical protein LQ344_006333 [Seirophora lacunosa]|nr:MAG: hypothetical protein LQ344_006333 [Seirophora lacunosa]
MSSPSLILFRGFPSKPAHVWSPFTTKLEARLRFAGLAYKTDQGAPPKGPRGKIPYLHIVRENNGEPESLSDTQLISEKLVADGLADDPNGKLTPAEKAHDLAIRALLEEKLYFYQNYERWEQNFYTMRSGVLAALPYPVQVLVGHLAYRKMSATLDGQGTSRFTPEEITKFKTEIWENLDALLTASRQGKETKKEKGLFFVLGGATPTEADTTLFGFIASGLVCAAAPETGKIIRSLPAVMEYTERIHSHYFPDYELWE